MMIGAVDFDLGMSTPVALHLVSSDGLAPLPIPFAQNSHVQSPAPDNFLVMMDGGDASQKDLALLRGAMRTVSDSMSSDAKTVEVVSVDDQLQDSVGTRVPRVRVHAVRVTLPDNPPNRVNPVNPVKEPLALNSVKEILVSDSVQKPVTLNSANEPLAITPDKELPSAVPHAVPVSNVVMPADVATTEIAKPDAPVSVLKETVTVSEAPELKSEKTVQAQPKPEKIVVFENTQNPVNLVNPVKEPLAQNPVKEPLVLNAVNEQPQASAPDKKLATAVSHAVPVSNVVMPADVAPAEIAKPGRILPAAAVSVDGQLQDPVGTRVPRVRGHAGRVTLPDNPPNPVNPVNPVKEPLATNPANEPLVLNVGNEPLAIDNDKEHPSAVPHAVPVANTVMTADVAPTEIAKPAAPVSVFKETVSVSEAPELKPEKAVQAQPQPEKIVAYENTQNPVNPVNPVKEPLALNSAKEIMASDSVQKPVLPNPANEPQAIDHDEEIRPEVPHAVPVANIVVPDAVPSDPAQVQSIAASASSARTEAMVESVAKTVEMVNQVVEAVVAKISVTPTLAQGEGEILITLKPTVLDGSEIHLSAKAGELTVSITPATPDTAQIVQQNLPRLETALAAHAPSFHHVAVVMTTSKKGRINETA